MIAMGDMEEGGPRASWGDRESVLEAGSLPSREGLSFSRALTLLFLFVEASDWEEW
jgi:hypothetical protein